MIDDVLQKYFRSEIAPSMAVMKLLLATGNYDTTVSQLAALQDPRVEPLLKLLRTHERGCRQVLAIARAEPRSDGAADAAEVISRYEESFDRSARISPTAGVALYSLGSEEILEQVTTEVIALLDRYGVLSQDRRILQIGCGAGRFEERLISRVALTCGIDISLALLAEGRKRSSRLALVQTDGRGLAPFRSGVFDLVYAIDSFPYIVNAGGEVLHAYFADTARVLRGAGDLVILNFSYRSTRSGDILEVASLARRFGFDTVVLGDQPLRTWDGTAFHLRKKDEG